ncbi:MAG: M20/M25/M40 family metallo-hydrolase, partial [Clostridia bacterium]|nr:M20/M25/M40 family metallo-hydrolase [Clostridia bacterium]
YVTEIKDQGFLKVINVGGLDTRIMQAADVVVYGKETFPAVVASTPPHLSDKKDRESLKGVDELLIDTGYSKEELEELVRVGTPIGFKGKYTDLLNRQLAGKGFDDKACAACAVAAIGEISKNELAGDVYLLLSAHEETDRQGGVVCGTYAIEPDYAMVVDVNLGKTPDTKSSETVKMGEGVALTLSAVTDRKLTKMTAELCSQKEIKFQTIVSATSTGTNATALSLVKGGVPVVDVGLPLKSMHTYNEVLDLDDADELVKLIKAFVSDNAIAEVFANV